MAWPREIAQRVFAAEMLAGSGAWNVAKWFESDDGRVSLLTYESFDEPFPALLESLTINLARGEVTRRSYRARGNPPVLHRKELLLPAEDPRRLRYAELTAQLEALGLLRSTTTIGTRWGWDRRLVEAGVEVVDHGLVSRDGREPPTQVRRHLAALQRSGLSTPIQALLKYGLIAPGERVFDYGCGRGSDVEGLTAAGVAATGWDPYFAPQTPKTEADVVNLGFVLNVIELPLERLEALREAFSLARRCLAVAVITSSRARLEACRPHADGYLTRLGTFQKFFEPDELRQLVEGALGREAHPAGPGLLFVFRDPTAEQAFLAARQARRPASPLLSLAQRRLARGLGSEAIRAELEVLLAQAYDLGRLPAPDECSLEVIDRLAKAKVTVTSALRQTLAASDPEVFAAARQKRRDELEVYFALNLFNVRRSYRALPERLQRDVKAFFGALPAAEAAGQALLQSLGAAETLAVAAEAARDAGHAWLDPYEDLWFATSQLSRLAAPIRCFVGCAARFAGGFEEAQVIKVHAGGGRLTALRYADFDLALLPRLEARTKVDLRARKVRVFDHYAEDQRLLFRSRLMSADDPGFERQARFDAQLAATGLSENGLRAAWTDIVSAVRASRPSREASPAKEAEG
jgi:DNA phosphorothioation-associated putative methyltransferase